VRSGGRDGIDVIAKVEIGTLRGLKVGVGWRLVG